MSPEYRVDLVNDLINKAIKEDVGFGDVTSETLFSHKDIASASVFVKQDATIAGIDVACSIIKKIGPRLEIQKFKADGDHVKHGERIFSVYGKLTNILKSERIALNFLQRMSGVATMTGKYVEALGCKKTKIYDTRKTIPGWRVLDKYAVRMGGGINHRYGLYDGILLKDNHLSYLSENMSLRDIILHVKKMNKRNVSVVVEVDSPAMALEASLAEPDVIMFDNFLPLQIKKALKMIKSRKIQFEASGGITLRNIRRYANLGLDRISIGALTHSVSAVDFTMLLNK